jgi:hypothetical protein
MQEVGKEVAKCHRDRKNTDSGEIFLGYKDREWEILQKMQNEHQGRPTGFLKARGPEGGMAQVAEHLPSKHKGLNSNLITVKNKTKTSLKQWVQLITDWNL